MTIWVRVRVRLARVFSRGMRMRIERGDGRKGGGEDRQKDLTGREEEREKGEDREKRVTRGMGIRGDKGVGKRGGGWGWE